MRRFSVHLIKFLRNEDGPTAVEYAVMLALIIIVCVVSITALGQSANKVFSNASLNSAMGNVGGGGSGGGSGSGSGS